MLKGLRLSKLYGRKGIITFESNGGMVLARSDGRLPRIIFPGFRDIRGYQAMYRDFRESIQRRRQPQMSLERAMDDQRLMDQIYASL
jgi:predicted dehydrogenase